MIPLWLLKTLLGKDFQMEPNLPSTGTLIKRYAAVGDPMTWLLKPHGNPDLKKK
jgi:hypothetical protein